MSSRPAGFVLALHSHLPWVLHHGRWPHGTDWLTEATLDSYLPLVAALRRLRHDQVPAPITLGLTPILASQLASSVFAGELEAYFAQRLMTLATLGPSLVAAGEPHLVRLVSFWQRRLQELRSLYRSLPGGLIGAFRELEADGRLELISSAATHAFLPLLARDESVRLQLLVGRAEHRRHFGGEPAGLWLPECGYRPAGRWQPLPEAPAAERVGLESLISGTGYRYCFLDSHQAGAGRSASMYDEPEERDLAPASNSPYQPYLVGPPEAGNLQALIRDPRASRQVWSRYEGYPGDEWYLEFHRIRWPSGVKLWRVSPPGTGLEAKEPYDPVTARGRADEHARHFVWLLADVLGRARAAEPRGSQVARLVAVPFDTELFGHWWFEGVEFLEACYRRLALASPLEPMTASQGLAADHPSVRIHPSAGSWGANGDFSMWLNPGCRWTWSRIWATEASFWRLAPGALRDPIRRPVLAQAAREMLLAQSSDWQFIMTTGQVTDYASRRFVEHADNADHLLAGLEPGGSGVQSAAARAAELEAVNHCFPEILEQVEQVLA